MNTVDIPATHRLSDLEVKLLEAITYMLREKQEGPRAKKLNSSKRTQA